MVLSFRFTQTLPDADVIYFCSPNNPTGAVATRAQLEELVAYASEKVCESVAFEFSDSVPYFAFYGYDSSTLSPVVLSAHGIKVPWIDLRQGRVGPQSKAYDLPYIFGHRGQLLSSTLLTRLSSGRLGCPSPSSRSMGPGHAASRWVLSMKSNSR